MATRDNFFRIFKGDDTNFIGNQELIVELQTTLDISQCSAHFKFLGFTQDFETIPADKKLHIVISAEQSQNFPIGCADACVWLIDQNEKRRTVANRIHMVVTNNIAEAYDPDDEQAITVVIKGGGGSGGSTAWEDITDKPSVFPPEDHTHTVNDITNFATAIASAISNWWTTTLESLTIAWSKLTNIPANLVVNASLSVDQKTLTLTKQSGSTVSFQGGGGSDHYKGYIDWTESGTVIDTFLPNDGDYCFINPGNMFVELYTSNPLNVIYYRGEVYAGYCIVDDPQGKMISNMIVNIGGAICVQN